MIKLFYPEQLYDSRFRGDLFPLLKPFIKKGAITDKERIAMYAISSSDIKIVATPHKADWVILPKSWNYYVENNLLDKAILIIQEASLHNKTVLSFTHGDFGVHIPNLKNIIVFRSSGERSQLPSYHKGLPSFNKDPLKTYYSTKNIFINNYSKKPMIGFCGLSNSSSMNAFKEIIRTFLRNFKYKINLSNELPQKLRSTSKLRSKVLNSIKQSPKLESKFIERNKYRAGANNKDQREKTTLEFFNNIKNTDYTICVRGAGNFSVRLYETLAMGRIPVFINTDCILPLADTIDWKKHVVWIEENEIGNIEEKIVQFHEKLNPDSFKNLQLQNRKLWEEQLTLGGFFKKELGV